MTCSPSLDLRSLVIGVDECVPTLDGRERPYVNLDNAASTPALRAVLDTVERLLPFYSGVHRGTGYKARLSTDAYERARAIVGRFVGAHDERDAVVFTKNTTEAVNRLARSLRADDDAVVLTTLLEHHSNDLPWRARARARGGPSIVHVGALPDGTLDIDHLDRLLAEHAGRVALLAVSGASNVTGVVQPVHLLARKVHAAGGRLLVDAAQLAAHRVIDMRPHHDPGHLDFVALSAHKMYAPFGTGALIGDRRAFAAEPDQQGGGTIRAVTVDDVSWDDLPQREEAGSPNVLGAVAMAAAALTLAEVGLDRIADHEARLTGYAMARLAEVPGVTVHGPTQPGAARAKVGVVPFSVEGIDHALVAAVLGYEHAIGVRNGCFCAQPYIAHLLGATPSDESARLERSRRGDVSGKPGLVRISLGCYNDLADVDRVVDAVARVAAGDIAGVYRLADDGTFRPRGYVEPGRSILREAVGAPGGRPA
ncbi:MAG TPA: aminotransferase class V-fold PLP-dependent enzyme [Acidimicrobiales bacterium]|nr:aminotransferase class V-fold PLP-dependent enzyme [Acidimicrobiales bacterium]